jgi:hypothetical protein
MMHMHNDFLQMRKKGSIILEMAIVAPIFFLVAAFLLTGISCLRADALFSQAIDQVTQEVAVGVPVAGGAIDVVESVLSMLNSSGTSETETGTSASPESKPNASLMNAFGGVGAAFDLLGIEVEDISATLLFGKGIRDRIVATFYTYFPKNDLLHERIQNVSVYLDYDKQNKVIWIRVYYEWKTFFGSAERMIESAVPVYGDLELTLPTTENSGSTADDVWKLSNFERGLSIRSSFGGNLPVTYPVIAGWNNGTATSIKSIDLTAPSYSTEGELTETVASFLDDLIRFEGTDAAWGSDQILITNEMILSRVLVIVIPENSPENVYNELIACNANASIQGIDIRIEKFGNSYRYVDQEQEQEQVGTDAS